MNVWSCISFYKHTAPPRWCQLNLQRGVNEDLSTREVVTPSDNLPEAWPECRQQYVACGGGICSLMPPSPLTSAPQEAFISAVVKDMQAIAVMGHTQMRAARGGDMLRVPSAGWDSGCGTVCQDRQEEKIR